MAELNNTRVEFSTGGAEGKQTVIMRLNDTSYVEMTPAAALGVAALIVKHALIADPRPADQRTILARMLAEARVIETPVTGV